MKRYDAQNVLNSQCSFQLQTMRNRPRNLQARRRRWPLRLGLFLIYVLVQYVASARTTSSETTTMTTLISSSSQYESSMSEPTESSITEEAIEKSSTASSVGKEPGKKIHTEGSKNEKASRGHGDAKASEKETSVRDLKEIAKEGKDALKKETESPLLKHVQSSSTTVSITNRSYAIYRKRVLCIVYSSGGL